MRLEFHPEVSTDVSKIIRYYEEVAGSQLAAEFDRALHGAFRKAAESPYAFKIRELEKLIKSIFPR